MARKSGGIVGATPQDEEELVGVDVEMVTTAPDDWEFDVHTSETPTHVEMEQPGDTFVGKFLEIRHIVPDKGGDPFDLLIFEARDGNPYSISPGYKLEKAFSEMPAETWCRITLMKLVDTGSKQPMKDYKVETKRSV